MRTFDDQIAKCSIVSTAVSEGVHPVDVHSVRQICGQMVDRCPDLLHPGSATTIFSTIDR